ncbi:MAG: hypothetical protein J0G30_04560 [Actinomycetales bacterium]|nr:hypothetical protein [Actinomycetales bacterium]
MGSSALITAITRDWRLDDAPVSCDGCGACPSSDLLAEAVTPHDPRMHGLVRAVEEVLDGAIESYLRGGEPESSALDRESRLASVDQFRARLRAQARRTVAEALARSAG